MTDQHLHRVHDGELYVQNRKGSPDHLAEQLQRSIDRNMPLQHSDFYEGLPYIALGTIDNRGRPWASLLVTRSDTDDGAGIQFTSPNRLELVSITSEHDPFVRALTSQHISEIGEPLLFAGVGVDFANRRRNKLAGVIQSCDTNTPGYLKLRLSSNQHLGNCPKYITVRTLVPHPRTPVLDFDSYHDLTEPLSPKSKAIITDASTVFLATKHDPVSRGDTNDERDMGFNHRGGSPGFIRFYEERKPCTGSSEFSTNTFLVLPDHSGNRFYQSLGNIQSDKMVGLTIPNFATGDVLYLTGEAENLFDEDAEELMPRAKLITKIRVTGAVLIQEALSLKLNSTEEYSPYNPPVRRLRSELAQELGVTELSNVDGEITARLASTIKHSATLSTFKFELSTPVEGPLPGGFGIFDFSGVFDSVYRHMDESNPQTVNDDHIRTWTLSSAPKFDSKQNRFTETSSVDITVKRKPGGLVSNYLHNLKHQSVSSNNLASLSVPFLGGGGDFSCFSEITQTGMPFVPERMIWIAGGAGITPFMSMWDGLINVNQALAKTDEQIATEIILYYACRDDDLNVVRHFLSEADQSNLRIKISCFQSSSPDEKPSQAINGTSIEHRRIEESDFTKINDLAQYEAFVCGPVAFMQHAESALRSAAGTELVVHQESYAF